MNQLFNSFPASIVDYFHKSFMASEYFVIDISEHAIYQKKEQSLFF